MFRTGENPLFDFPDIPFQGLSNSREELDVLFDKLRQEFFVEAQQVVGHQYLAVAFRPGPDSDGGDPQGPGDQPGQLIREYIP